MDKSIHDYMDIDCNLSDIEVDFSIDDAIDFKLEIDEKLLKLDYTCLDKIQVEDE